MINIEALKAMFLDRRTLSRSGIQDLFAEIERLQAENERIRKKAAIGFNNELNLDADVAKLQARQELLEKVVEAGKYLSAEVLDAWELNEISIDAFSASEAFENSIAALKAQATPESTAPAQPDGPDR